MNKTIPRDGKRERQSLDYVPSGPVYSGRYFAHDRYALKVASIARRFGEIIEIDDHVRSRVELYPKWTYAMSVRKRGQRVNVVAKHRSCSAMTEIRVVSDENGHRALCKALTAEIGRYGFGPFSTWKAQDVEETKPDKYPPVTKRLTGKERKIAKKRAAENAANKLSEE